MNNINDSKPSKKVFLLTLLAILFVGIPLTVLALQKQQFIKDFAWSTTQSASPKCTTDTGNATIQVTFTNTESSKDMDVIAQDLQTGNVVNLGTVKANKTATDTIVTEEKSLKAGSVLFTMKWTDGSSGSDTRTADYKALSACAPPPPYCPANPTNNTGYCQWDPLAGATGYDVSVNDTTTGELIASGTISSSASQSALPFPMMQGKSYSCSVKPISECRTGHVIKSDPKICTPTPPVCPVPPQKLGECSWSPVTGATGYNVTVKDTGSGETIKAGTVKSPDTSLSYTADPDKTYQCTVSAINSCSQSTPINSEPFSCNIPTPSAGPSPSSNPSETPMPSTTPRPGPTATPTPTPTLTPTATPTPTPTMTPTPKPSATPYPTLTPYVIVRTIVNNQVVQNPPPSVVVTQTQQVTQPTTYTQPQSTQAVQPTAAPKVKPTGNSSSALILIGTSTILLFVGGILFFLL